VTVSLVPLIVLGFFLGVRHATDPDHVVAVTTILSRERQMSMAARVGALWGMGHTMTVMAVGGAIILFGVVIPPRIGLTMEFSVAIMLVLLGTLNLSGLLKRVGAAHDQADHQLQLTQDHVVSGRMRPLAIGLVHGLAGSAAAALLVLAAVHETGSAMAYLLLFCVGTMAGMMLMTSALALPIIMTANRFAHLDRWIAQGTGLASVLFGLFMAYQVGIHDGLFSGHPVWSPH